MDLLMLFHTFFPDLKFKSLYIGKKFIIKITLLFPVNLFVWNINYLENIEFLILWKGLGIKIMTRENSFVVKSKL